MSRRKVRLLVAKLPPSEQQPRIGPLAHKCPHCLAKPGVPCLDWWGEKRKPHEARLEALWAHIRNGAKR